MFLAPGGGGGEKGGRSGPWLPASCVLLRAGTDSLRPAVLAGEARACLTAEEGGVQWSHSVLTV